MKEEEERKVAGVELVLEGPRPVTVAKLRNPLEGLPDDTLVWVNRGGPISFTVRELREAIREQESREEDAAVVATAAGLEPDESTIRLTLTVLSGHYLQLLKEATSVKEEDAGARLSLDSLREVINERKVKQVIRALDRES